MCGLTKSLRIVVSVLLCNAIHLYLSLNLDTRWVTMSAVPLEFKLSKSFFFLFKEIMFPSLAFTVHIKTKVHQSDVKLCVAVLVFAADCLTQEVGGMIVRLFLDVKKSVSVVSCMRNKKAMTKQALLIIVAVSLS